MSSENLSRYIKDFGKRYDAVVMELTSRLLSLGLADQTYLYGSRYGWDEKPQSTHTFPR